MLIRAGLQHAADNTAGTTSVVLKVGDTYNGEVLKRSLKKRTAPETQ
jgi:hypothetical protein